MNPPTSARSVDEQGSPQPRVVPTGTRPAGRTTSPADEAPTATPTRPAADSEKASRRDAPAPKARARHAHLFLTHFDPWSVMKNSFMMSLALAIVLLVAVTVLWSLLALSGTLDAVTGTLTDIAGGGADTLNMADLFSFSRVIGVTSVLAVLEVILVTALATLFAFLYNIAVGITGGLQVTLTDDS
jgi:hypothetical protein